MKKYILLCLLGIVSHARSQDMTRYKKLTDEAFKLYEEKKYLESATRYNEAFASLNHKGYAEDRYNAACSWAMAGMVDSSFTQLFKIAERTKYANLNHLKDDSDLNSLHSDARWNKLVTIVAANKKEKEKDLDQVLVARLDSIYHDDQDGRKSLREYEKQYGYGSQEMKDLWKDIRYKDSINLVKVIDVLETRGWLGPKEIGEEGSGVLFLVIQHSNQATQEKYLPAMQRAVKEGKASASNLALLEDRVALGQGKHQLYGSQIGRDDSTGKYYVQPLYDPDNVDKRREQMGLGPIADYVKNWDMVWDAEAYKKQLPALERKRFKK
jgi:hypothetical protein